MAATVTMDDQPGHGEEPSPYRLQMPYRPSEQDADVLNAMHEEWHWCVRMRLRLSKCFMSRMLVSEASYCVGNFLPYTIFWLAARHSGSSSRERALSQQTKLMLAAALVSTLVARSEASACDGTRVPTSVPALRAHRDFAALDAVVDASMRGCDVTYAEHTDTAFANSNAQHGCTARFEEKRAMGTFQHIPKTWQTNVEPMLHPSAHPLLEHYVWRVAQGRECHRVVPWLGLFSPR